MGGGSTFAKTICSICYEDLKPIVEDLQAISICGHVFHELCLQQWFEYCSSTKKNSCPVCKQTCSQNNVGRLYFQSVGDPNDSILSQKPFSCEEDTEALRREVKRLETKVSGLNSASERQQKDIKELNEELCICKEQAKKEATLKNEALGSKASIQLSLHSKSEELDRSTGECNRLKDRNMAIAKELAALKLVSDLNLEEEEVLKLASLGNEANNKDTIDILKKSLVVRNKSYKELMAKCNLLGRGEARSLQKFEIAKEKIRKLKTRVQELETAIEVKDNEVLRALKASKKTTCKGSNLDRTGSLTNDSFCSGKTENSNPIKDRGVNNTKDDISLIALDQEIDSYFLIDEDVDASEISTDVHEFSYPVSKPRTSEDAAAQKSSMSRPEAASGTKNEALVHRPSKLAGLLDSSTGGKNDMVDTPVAAMDEDAMLLLDDIIQVQPLPHIKKETPYPVPLSQPGDRCFFGGFLGPDRTQKNVGKWGKREQRKGSMGSSMPMQGSSTSTGDLIAVGADGRGGKIKVLRSLNQPSLDSKETSVWAKRCKYGAKTSSLQSQGCLQIEHFFGRAGH